MTWLVIEGPIVCFCYPCPLLVLGLGGSNLFISPLFSLPWTEDSEISCLYWDWPTGWWTLLPWLTDSLTWLNKLSWFYVPILSTKWIKPKQDKGITEHEHRTLLFIMHSPWPFFVLFQVSHIWPPVVKTFVGFCGIPVMMHTTNLKPDAFTLF